MYHALFIFSRDTVGKGTGACSVILHSIGCTVYTRASSSFIEPSKYLVPLPIPIDYLKSQSVNLCAYIPSIVSLTCSLLKMYTLIYMYMYCAGLMEHSKSIATFVELELCRNESKQRQRYRS